MKAKAAIWYVKYRRYLTPTVIVILATELVTVPASILRLAIQAAPLMITMAAAARLAIRTGSITG